MRSPGSAFGLRPFAAAVAAGLAAGFVLGRARSPGRAPPEVADAGRPDARASPPPPEPPPDAGSPPAAIRADLEAAVAVAFRAGAPGSPEEAAREAAFARVRALVDAWAAEAPRSPLAAAGWWREALRGALRPVDPRPPGVFPGAVRWAGRPFPVVFSAPEGPGPHAAVLALVAGDPHRAIREAWGDLPATHLVIAVPCTGAVAEDPRLAMLAIPEASRRWAVDRDRVVLDGTGFGADAAARIAPGEAARLAGVVLRRPAVPGEPEENLASVPVLAILPEGGGERSAQAREALARACPRAGILGDADGEEVAAWIRTLPPRRSADPRSPVAWTALPGEAYRPWGPGFVVRERGAGGEEEPVRVSLRRDPSRNAVLLETENAARVLLLLSDEGLDLDRPVAVVAGGKTLSTRRVERSLETLRTWALQEPGLLVTAELEVEVPQ